MIWDQIFLGPYLHIYICIFETVFTIFLGLNLQYDVEYFWGCICYRRCIENVWISNVYHCWRDIFPEGFWLVKIVMIGEADEKVHMWWCIPWMAGGRIYESKILRTSPFLHFTVTSLKKLHVPLTLQLQDLPIFTFTPCLLLWEPMH